MPQRDLCFRAAILVDARLDTTNSTSGAKLDAPVALERGSLGASSRALTFGTGRESKNQDPLVLRASTGSLS
jgi:hypothetical protein